MKKIIFLAILAFSFQLKAQIYKSTEGTVSFFSEAPLANIDATSKHLVSAINSQKKEIVFEVGIKSLEFVNKKMQEDFNEDFMESEKYPVAVYKGNVNETIDWRKDGTYKITSTGTLTIHGVEKQRTDTASVTIESGKVKITGEFMVRVADHKIKVPKLVYQKIAEVVQVKFNVTYLETKLISENNFINQKK